MKTIQKIIVTDMDDTMIEQYGTPTNEIKKFWNSLCERGDIILVVATGQQYAKVKDVFLSNEMTLPHYVLADQGTMIFDTRKNEIVERFALKNEDIVKIVQQFYALGGKKEFMRIYTGTVVIAYDCPQAKEFFQKTSQQNVLYGKDIDYVLKNGHYSKVILMDETDLVNKLVLFALNNTTTIPINTGMTSYGNCGFSRFEVVDSDKKTSLSTLLERSFNFPSKTSGENYDLHLLALGDEQSDYGLAQIAMSVNLYPDSKGHFALVQSGSKGNKILIENVQELSVSLGMNDKVILTDSVKENGWITAVEKWLKAIDG